MALVKRFVSIILFYKHTLRACDVMEVAMRAPNYKSKVSALTSVYKNLKVASAQVMGSRFFNAIYEDLIERLLIFEEHMSKDFIVDSSPEFEYNDPRFFNLTASSLDTDEKILDYVVWLVRRDLFDRLKGYYPEIESLDDLDLANECYHASFLVKGIFS
ncbi:MAG: hypothetical protein IJ475_02390 [Bacilli bacterium]|nr:hypothetical protein [Bacilli bacterium]